MNIGRYSGIMEDDRARIKIIQLPTPSLRQRRREGGRAQQRPGESTERVFTWRRSTHPDYATLVGPLFAKGVKRAIKIKSVCPIRGDEPPIIKLLSDK